MTLSIETPHSTFYWNFGKGNRELVMASESDITIDRIKADGEELKLIKRLFQNLPIPAGEESAVWYGETAKFIVVNLQSMIGQYSLYISNKSTFLMRTSIADLPPRLLAKCLSDEWAEVIRDVLQEWENNREEN